LDAAIERVHAAHPNMGVDDEAFAAVLGACVAGADDVAGTVETLNVEDLYLATACARGAPKALAALERDHMRHVRTALGRILGPSEVDDGVQSVREKLLVGSDGAPPRIGEYVGRGALSSWIKVVAVRTALSALRKRRPEAAGDEEDPLLDLPASVHTQVEPFVLRYGPAFKRAFQAALAELDARERTLLRFSYVDGLTVDEIGGLYRVHRATAARWVAQAREHLGERTRVGLARELGTHDGGLTSILEIIQSHVDVSLGRVLGDASAKPPDQVER
jgi:RNA polymerase sigma-70 factor (ECF subfamily)